jgi:hypothetical protein
MGFERITLENKFQEADILVIVAEWFKDKFGEVPGFNIVGGTNEHGDFQVIVWQTLERKDKQHGN